MLKIGEFSKLSRVSVRMLRHYDDIGLLHPAEIDRFTDYRYYSEAQLPTVCRITALKDMGFRLADICRMLDFYDDRQRLDECLAAQQAVLEAGGGRGPEAAAAGQRTEAIEKGRYHGL